MLIAHLHIQLGTSFWKISRIVSIRPTSRGVLANPLRSDIAGAGGSDSSSQAASARPRCRCVARPRSRGGDNINRDPLASPFALDADPMDSARSARGQQLPQLAEEEEQDDFDLAQLSRTLQAQAQGIAAARQKRFMQSAQPRATTPSASPQGPFAAAASASPSVAAASPPPPPPPAAVDSAADNPNELFSEFDGDFNDDFGGELLP